MAFEDLVEQPEDQIRRTSAASAGLCGINIGIQLGYNYNNIGVILGNFGVITGNIGVIVR